MSFTFNVGCLLILCTGKICCFGVIEDFDMERVCCDFTMQCLSCKREERSSMGKYTMRFTSRLCYLSLALNYPSQR